MLQGSCQHLFKCFLRTGEVDVSQLFFSFPAIVCGSEALLYASACQVLLTCIVKPSNLVSLLAGITLFVPTLSQPPVPS